MKEKFSTIDPREIKENTFKAIGDDWMLVTAGNADSWNTMTASWGTMGVLWNLPVAICFIRPQRYTYLFAEKFEYHTLSFFTEEHREILKFCGSRSGRDYNKAKETGLIPFSTDLGNTGFAQASMIVECKKLYADNLKPGNFLIQDLISKNYPRKDFHRFYIGEVVNVLIKEE